MLFRSVDASIPFTILAFFPEYRMKDFKRHTVQEIIETYQRVKDVGLKNIRLGNIGIFVRTEEDQEYFLSHVDKGVC